MSRLDAWLDRNATAVVLAAAAIGLSVLVYAGLSLYWLWVSP